MLKTCEKKIRVRCGNSVFFFFSFFPQDFFLVDLLDCLAVCDLLADVVDVVDPVLDLGDGVGEARLEHEALQPAVEVGDLGQVLRGGKEGEANR